jgi:flagellar basal-body rod modification protein FlgD
MDYMKLLITQLQNQNPLEPLDNNEMASQLAQFSQLSQLESMNTSFAQVLEDSKNSYAASLLGKHVRFFGQLPDGSVDVMTGVVQEVVKDPETGKNVLMAGEYALKVEDILSVGI